MSDEQKPRPRGRPPKYGPDGLPLDQFIRVRCTSLELRSWHDKSSKAEFSEWTRAALNAAPSWDKLQRKGH